MLTTSFFLHLFLVFFSLFASGSIFRTKETKTSSNAATTGKISTQEAASIVADVKACLDAKLNGRKFKKETKKSRYTLMSGHTLELLNALHPHQIKQIQFLTKCVQEHAPQLFIESQSSADAYYRYGGSNVTFLTNILPQVLPDLQSHFLSLMQKGLQSSFWTHLKHKSNHNYGIRSIYVISADKPGYDLFMHLIDAKKGNMLPETIEIPANMPDSDAVLYQRFHQYLHLIGKHRAAHRSRFVSDHYGTDFTLYSALTDFSDSCNADYLLRRHATDEDIEMEKDDEDFEDLEEIAQPKEYEHLDLLGKKKKQEENEEDEEVTNDNKQETERSFYQDEFENYMPERGNMLLIRGNSHGPNELLCGKRESLIIEYWSYRDAPMQVGVASLAQGQDELGLLPQPEVARSDL